MRGVGESLGSPTQPSTDEDILMESTIRKTVRWGTPKAYHTEDRHCMLN